MATLQTVTVYRSNTSPDTTLATVVVVTSSNTPPLLSIIHPTTSDPYTQIYTSTVQPVTATSHTYITPSILSSASSHPTSSEFSPGEIVGITFGALGFVTALCVLVWFLPCCRRKPVKHEKPPAYTEVDPARGPHLLYRYESCRNPVRVVHGGRVAGGLSAKAGEGRVRDRVVEC